MALRDASIACEARWVWNSSLVTANTGSGCSVSLLGNAFFPIALDLCTGKKRCLKQLKKRIIFAIQNISKDVHNGRIHCKILNGAVAGSKDSRAQQREPKILSI